jgi:hypothetical protein
MDEGRAVGIERAADQFGEVGCRGGAQPPRAHGDRQRASSGVRSSTPIGGMPRAASCSRIS